MSLNVNHVTKKYSHFTAVNDLSFDVSNQQIFGLLGANGAGKTTTFRMILGLLSPTKGTIQWNDSPIDYSTSHSIGYLPEERGLYPNLKVRDQLLYLGRLRGMRKKEILIEMEKWLERFNVPEYATKKVEELSKGNQQKIQFIAAVINKPRLIILDEPFSGLDPVNVEMLKRAVTDLKSEGSTIVFSSHRMDHVEELCESLCILHKGNPVVQGSLKSIKKAFGKKNLIIHADFDLEELKSITGVTQFKTVTEGAHIQVSDEKVAYNVFQKIKDKGFVRKFELEEPSLEDIFIEKVGASFE